MNVDRCVCCGEIVPEGRLTCPICESKAGQKMTDIKPLPCPCCGEKRKFIRPHLKMRQYMIVCPVCNFHGDWVKDRKKLFSAWNNAVEQYLKHEAEGD